MIIIHCLTLLLFILLSLCSSETLNRPLGGVGAALEVAINSIKLAFSIPLVKWRAGSRGEEGACAKPLLAAAMGRRPPKLRAAGGMPGLSWASSSPLLALEDACKHLQDRDPQGGHRDARLQRRSENVSYINTMLPRTPGSHTAHTALHSSPAPLQSLLVANTPFCSRFA